MPYIPLSLCPHPVINIFDFHTLPHRLNLPAFGIFTHKIKKYSNYYCYFNEVGWCFSINITKNFEVQGCSYSSHNFPLVTSLPVTRVSLCPLDQNNVLLWSIIAYISSTLFGIDWQRVKISISDMFPITPLFFLCYACIVS